MNIFEKAKSIKSELIDDYHRIHTLFSVNKYIITERNGQYKFIPIETYIDREDLFLEWKDKGRYINVNDYRTSLEIDNETMNQNINKEKLFYYIEYVVNFITLLFIRSFSKNPQYTKKNILIFIKENIIDTLDRLNYSLVEIGSYKSIVVPKDSRAIHVAEKYPDISEVILEYKHFKWEGNIKEKASKLQSLWKAFEPIRQQLYKKHKSLIDNIGLVMNDLDVRHNSTEGPKANKIVPDMSSEELEMWYDRAYDALLIAFMLNEYYEIEPEFTELRRRFKEQK